MKDAAGEVGIGPGERGFVIGERGLVAGERGLGRMEASSDAWRRCGGRYCTPLILKVVWVAIEVLRWSDPSDGLGGCCCWGYPVP